MMRARSIGYWILSLVLIGFGFLSLFSIGGPLLLTGLAMVAAGPWHRRRDVLWPALAGVWSFALAYALVAPLGCTSTSTAVPAGPSTVGRTSCTNVLGIDYSGGGAYQAPLMPALLVAAAALVVGIAAYMLLAGRSPSVPPAAG